MIDFPGNTTSFGKDILLHPVLESLGIFSGMRYYFFLKRKSPEKLPLTISLAIIAGATAGALLGSKSLEIWKIHIHYFQQIFQLKDFGPIIRLLEVWHLG